MRPRNVSPGDPATPPPAAPTHSGCIPEPSAPEGASAPNSPSARAAAGALRPGPPAGLPPPRPGTPTPTPPGARGPAPTDPRAGHPPARPAPARPERPRRAPGGMATASLSRCDLALPSFVRERHRTRPARPAGKARRPASPARSRLHRLHGPAQKNRERSDEEGGNKPRGAASGSAAGEPALLKLEDASDWDAMRGGDSRSPSRTTPRRWAPSWTLPSSRSAGPATQSELLACPDLAEEGARRGKARAKRGSVGDSAARMLPPITHPRRRSVS